jgi:hypothetical protein
MDMRRLLLLALFALMATASTAWAEAEQAPPASLKAQLAAVHENARDAREKRQFARVEQLRLERLALLESAARGDDKAAATSPWVAGAIAITKADSLIKAMRYEQACKLLEKAWQPFAQSSRNEPVFGDVAMKLFEATQAALAVYSDFNAVDPTALRKAVQTAADADPCAVEAKAADAFLTTPNPDESFEPAELRPSLKARNQLLLDISYDREKDELALPWHAPTEYLKAQSSSFVLGDLGYGERFLGPRRLLHGRDGYDEPFTLVMGGALLIHQRDADGLKRPIVADYSAKQERWLRMRPRILRVEPPSYKPQPWQIDEASLNADIRAVVEAAAAERQLVVCNRLISSADGLKAASKAKSHIRKILGWMNNPPKGQKPPTFEEAIQLVAQGYVNYALRYPEERDEVEKAHTMVLDAGKQWGEFRQVSDAAWAAAGGNDANVDAATAAKALANFLSLVAKEDADATDAAEAAQATDAEAADADKAAEANALRLDARELRSKLSQQKEHYDTLALFQLMNSVHRPALEALLTKTTPPPQTALSAPNDDQGPTLTERLGQALRQYDAAFAKATARQPMRGADASAARSLVITLDTLRQTSAAVREMIAVLREMAAETERADFLDRFARTLDDVNRTVTLEAEMVRFCTPENLGRDWKVGRTTWQVYDFPADIPQDRLAGMINACPRLAFSLDDFDRLVKGPGEDGLPTNARLPLVAGCTSVTRNRLVENRNNQPTLRVPRGIADPWTAVLLDVDPEAGSDFAPALAKGADGDYLWLDDIGGRVRMSFITKSGAEPAMVVRFAGADGYLPLGASPDAFDVFDARRILKDRRGNTITLDQSPETSLTRAHYYQIRSPSGETLTDRSVNYVIQDWLDLDRNIVNSFLPDVILLAPSLPTWRLYRNEYARPAPRSDWKWMAPRRIFSLAPEPAGDPNAPPPAP